MTHENDFLQLHTENFGRVRVCLNQVDLQWPPPQFLIFDDGGVIREADKHDPRDAILERIRFSQLTDDQIKEINGVARGAEYKYMKGVVGVDN